MKRIESILLAIGMMLVLWSLLAGCGPNKQPDKTTVQLTQETLAAVERGDSKVVEAIPLIAEEKPGTLLTMAHADFVEAIKTGKLSVAGSNKDAGTIAKQEKQIGDLKNADPMRAIVGWAFLILAGLAASAGVAAVLLKNSFVGIIAGCLGALAAVAFALYALWTFLIWVVAGVAIIGAIIGGFLLYKWLKANGWLAGVVKSIGDSNVIATATDAQKKTVDAVQKAVPGLKAAIDKLQAKAKAATGTT